MTSLQNHDPALRNQAPSRGAGGLHQRLPGRTVLARSHGPRGFTGTDRFAGATQGQKAEDLLLQLLIQGSNAMGSTSVGAKLHALPVALPGLAPFHRATAGGAVLGGLWTRRYVSLGSAIWQITPPYCGKLLYFKEPA